MLADRAEHQTHEAAVTALTDHQQVCVRRLVDENLRRSALLDVRLDEDRRLLAEFLLDDLKQTSALDEERMFAKEPAEAATDGADPVTGAGADPGGRSPTR